MNKTGLIIFSFSIWICSCGPEDSFVFDERCDVNSEINAPEGVEISKVGVLGINGSLLQLQFPDAETGYVLGSYNYGGYVELFKSEDGGRNWKRLNLDWEVRPADMHFMNKDEGFITLSGQTDILITPDGGSTWERISYPNLAERVGFSHLSSDPGGNLYISAFSLETGNALFKSRDKGRSWDTLFVDQDLGNSSVTFSYQLFGNKIYAGGRNGKIYLLDSAGSHLATFQAPLSTIYDMEVIDEENLVVSGASAMVISNDGGLSWDKIHEQRGKIIGFNSAGKGYLILNNSSCPNDVVQSNDAISVTFNGGMNWIQGAETTNLFYSFANAQGMSDESYLMLIDNTVYRLKEAD